MLSAAQVLHERNTDPMTNRVNETRAERSYLARITSWTSRLGRSVRARLIRPLHSVRHPPEYMARGVFFGLLVALSPTTGIQMPMIFVIWLLVRKFRSSWNFNLLVALAWTWVTNVLTIPPLYYLYVVTGRALLGWLDRIKSFETFESRLSETLSPDAGWLEALWVYTVNFIDKFGLPVFVGSIPWTIMGSWLGYKWSLALIRRVRARRRRMEVSDAHH